LSVVVKNPKSKIRTPWMRRASNRSGHPRLDLEEIRPDQYVVHNPQIAGLIRHEGELQDRMFRLTTWRRSGLVARLRQRGFRVSTLEDTIDALPAPPAPPVIGRAFWRVAEPNDRFSFFDPRTLAWQPLTLETRDDAPGVTLRTGWVVRRRKGHAPPTYFLALGPSSARPLDETAALLAGYAQAAEASTRLHTTWRDDTWAVPALDLPGPYRAVLRRIASAADDGWQIGPDAQPLAERLFARLGLAVPH
jgi:hypothetical protein